MTGEVTLMGKINVCPIDFILLSALHQPQSRGRFVSFFFFWVISSKYRGQHNKQRLGANPIALSLFSFVKIVAKGET